MPDALWRRRGLALVCGLVVAGCLGEGTVRLLGWGAPVQGVDVQLAWEVSAPEGARSPFRYHDTLPDVTLAPGVTGRMVYRSVVDGGVVHAASFTVSPEGLRGASPEEGARDRRRVLVVGDSVTFGQGVEDDETYVAALEREAPRAVQTLNAGVPSWDLRSETAWLDAQGWALAPDLVVLGFYVNDVAPSPRAVPEALERTPPRRAPAWARAPRTLRRWSHLLNFAARRLEAERLARAYLPEPSAGDPRRSYLDDLRRQFDRGALEARFVDLAAGCARQRVPCVVAMLPVLVSGHDDSGADLIDAVTGIVDEVAAREPALRVVRVDDVLTEVPPDARDVLPADRHPSARLHRVIGRRLAERLPWSLLDTPGAALVEGDAQASDGTPRPAPPVAPPSGAAPAPRAAPAPVPPPPGPPLSASPPSRAGSR